MKLSLKQRGALLRMSMHYIWIPPAGDGRVQHGLHRTLCSLEKHGLVRYLRTPDDTYGDYTGPGWVLTEEGRSIAKSEGKPCPALFREATR